MKDVENSTFWKEQFIKIFELNDIGKKLLDLLDIENQKLAYKYMNYEFKKFNREEIIEIFCKEFNEIEINRILEQLDYEKIDKYEIEMYEIDTENEEEIL